MVIDAPAPELVSSKEMAKKKAKKKKKTETKEGIKESEAAVKSQTVTMTILRAFETSCRLMVIIDIDKNNDIMLYSYW